MTRAQKELIGFLVKDHWDRLVQYAYRKTGDRELAKDLAQEVMLVACAKAQILEKHPYPEAWCYTTLHNLIMRECKKAYHANEALTAEIYPSICPADEFTLDECLPINLAPTERELIVLRLKYGLSVTQIAEQKGLSYAACRKQISRAYEKCRKLLEKEK